MSGPFVLPGEWATSPSGKRICQVARPIIYGDTLHMSDFTNWQGEPPKLGDPLPECFGPKNREGLGVFIEGRGWLP